MIDVHCHVFNVNYFPLEGVLRARNVPRWLAGPLAAALKRLAQSDPDLGDHAAFMRLDFDDALALAAEATPAGTLDRDGGEAALGALARHEAARIGVAGDDLDAFPPIVTDAVAEKTAPPAIDLGGQDGALLRLLLTKARKYLRDALGSRESAEAFLKFLLIMLQGERLQFDRLQKVEHQKVDLFVHHMMDMQRWYANEPPVFDFASEQIPRMRDLALESGGRLAGFVAFDPSRDDGLDIVRDAIAQGFWGVKFYPPNGYLPLHNADEAIDHANLELFKYCVENDIPVLSHCSPGGMLAPDVSGDNADPRHWYAVLERTHEGVELCTLRLCLAHAGGCEGWFARPVEDPDSDIDWATSDAIHVVQLCTDASYPNVYCDTSYLQDVLDAEKRGHFATRLAALLSATPTPPYTILLADRILYGSDYPMLYREAENADYLDCFEDIFAREELEPFADRVFHANAVRFLNVRGYLDRCGHLVADDAKERLSQLLA